VGDGKLLGLKLIQVASEKIKTAKDRMKVTQDRQKSYADNRKRSLELNVGDNVFLKVAPRKYMLRFNMKEKLAPRYIKLFEIT
jgi:hypothetical protein